MERVDPRCTVPNPESSESPAAWFLSVRAADSSSLRMFVSPFTINNNNKKATPKKRVVHRNVVKFCQNHCLPILRKKIFFGDDLC